MASPTAEELAPSFVDLVPASSVLPEVLAALPSQDEAPGNFGSARPSGVGIAVDRQAPAQDQGTNAGKPTPPAFRLDRSTLHARLSDGASVYQPEHERTSRTASSPQAERRERVTGIGEVSRSQRPATVNDPAFKLPEQNSEADDLQAAESDEHSNRKALGVGVLRGQGPLAAEEGERRFDVGQEGTARDSRWAPQLSAELHVGLMDLSAVSAPGPQDGTAGKGVGKQNGSVALASQGTAPSVAGGAAVTGQGPGGEGEALRVRHELEIGQRIHRFLRFPHHLELMLEQGETIVAFVVTAEGRLAGRVEVIKSAGFSEFDEEAVAAVQRAAPFSPPGRALALSVRVPFQNPVVR
jgi:TonB family protein